MGSRIRAALSYQRFAIEPDVPMCVTCRHFRPHYTKEGASMLIGHCVYPRLKSRTIMDECEKWERLEENA